MSKKLSLVLCACLILISQAGWSQESMSVADKQFELGAIDLAINSYKSMLKSEPTNEAAKLKLAQCYFMKNDYLNAEKYFSQCMTSPLMQAEDVLTYGHILKSLGKYQEAKLEYGKYAEVNDSKASHFQFSCDEALMLISEEPNYEFGLTDWNSSQSEFSASIFNDNLVVASFSDALKRADSKINYSSINPRKNELIVCETSSGDSKFLRTDIEENKGVGPINYSADYSKALITKNNFVDGIKIIGGQRIEMSTYIADVDENGNYFDEKPLPINSAHFANGFACFANDKEVIFSSNRNGGFGGFDLYSTTKLENGTWTVPVNLGPVVNGPGNEITPFVDDNTLYFSSDYHSGLGGYDVFRSDKSNGSYESIENMSYGINSPADDYSMIKHNDTYYFASNRIGGMGGSDIYWAKDIEFEDFAMVKSVDFMPPALNLKDLEKPKSDEAGVVMTVALNETKSSTSETIATARKVAYDDQMVKMNNTMVHFVQIASLSRGNKSNKDYSDLTDLGNVYKVYKGQSVKIRVGYFMTRDEAYTVLLAIKNRGYKDAFMVYEPLNTSQLELISSSYYDQTTQSNDYNNTNSSGNYKVRLASYSDPLWFETESVADIGQIEQWSKGQWTIFVLSGYNSLEEAKAARIKAVNRGFTDAEVVRDNNGILEKLESN